MFNPFKKKVKRETANFEEKSQTNSEKSQEFKKLDPIFYDKVQNDKKKLLGQNAITREELIEYLQNEAKAKNYSDINPYKTREDVYITFFSSTMQIVRNSVPFEEIKIQGSTFLINKKWENGEIKIIDLFPYPELEINLEEETANKETTKNQLEELNKQILYIKKKIAEGDEKYALIDIEDLKAEKIRLEKILDSIKYGKKAFFAYIDPHKLKKHFWMRYTNGDYLFLKVTENNYIVGENNVKKVQGTQIISRVESITNLRNKINLKQILFSIVAFIMFIIFCGVMFKLYTFEEALLDKRVADNIATITISYQEEIDYYRQELSKYTSNYNYNNNVNNNPNLQEFQQPR
jgi:hypothetical protein